MSARALGPGTAVNIGYGKIWTSVARALCGYERLSSGSNILDYFRPLPDTAHPLTFHSALTQLSHRGVPVMPDLMTEFGRNENVRSNVHRRRRRVTKPSEQPNAVHDCLQYWMIIRTRRQILTPPYALYVRLTHPTLSCDACIAITTLRVLLPTYIYARLARHHVSITYIYTHPCCCCFEFSWALQFRSNSSYDLMQ